jgi:steroid 5-alpha reductase family enzyme
LFGVAASPTDAWWLFAGALAMLAMFLGASIPMMEQRSLEQRPGYQDLVERVPRFLPRPPHRRRHEPSESQTGGGRRTG